LKITEGYRLIPSIEKQVRRFIIENFLFGQGADQLRNDDSFLDKGIIDSTGVLELVSFLEERYRIKIEDEELIPDHLDSVDKLVEFIERKLKRG